MAEDGGKCLTEKLPEAHCCGWGGSWGFQCEVGQYCQKWSSPHLRGWGLQGGKDPIYESWDEGCQSLPRLHLFFLGGWGPLWHFSAADSSKESLWQTPASFLPSAEGTLGLIAANSCEEPRVMPLHCPKWNLIHNSVHGPRNKNNI